jgi:hypothetical protein
MYTGKYVSCMHHIAVAHVGFFFPRSFGKNDVRVMMFVVRTHSASTGLAFTVKKSRLYYNIIYALDENYSELPTVKTPEHCRLSTLYIQTTNRIWFNVPQPL